jgi:hypothetical protein
MEVCFNVYAPRICKNNNHILMPQSMEQFSVLLKTSRLIRVNSIGESLRECFSDCVQLLAWCLGWSDAASP